MNLYLSLFTFAALASGLVAQTSPPQQDAKKPLVLNALNYTNQPDLKEQQLGDVVMIYEAELYPDLPDRKDRSFPTEAGWANFDTRVAASPPGTPICIDLELESHRPYPWTKEKDWEAVVDLFRRIAIEAKSRSGGRPVGFYGLFPIDNPIPNAVLNEVIHPRKEMQAHNDMSAPAIAEVDILFPCNYISGNVYDAHSRKVMKSIADEAARIAPGKPCYLFFSPQQQNTSTMKFPDLDYKTARPYFDTVFEIFGPTGGGIIWGGYDIGIPKREEDGNLLLEWPGLDAPWAKALLEAMAHAKN